jgi:hypothetical protein
MDRDAVIAKLRLADQPWKDIAGSGNVYRHNYERVIEEYV